MSSREMIGKCMWCAKVEGGSFSGDEPCWWDKNATLDELWAAVDPDFREDVLYFYCEEWQKVWWWVKRVEIKRYEVTDAGNS
jgi:hypothetical protein